MTSKTQWTGVAFGLTAAAIWGGMYVVSKVVLDVIPPFSLLTLRLVLGALVLALVVAWKRYPALSRRQLGEVLGVGFIGFGISLGLQFTGTHLSTASNGALVTSATPAFVVPFAAWLLGEKLTARRFWALALAPLGVRAVLDPRHADLSSRLFLGNLSLVGAALTWALFSVLVRRVTRRLPVVQATLFFLLGGLVLSIPASVFELQAAPLGAITPGVVAGVLYLGVVSTALAMFLWNQAFATLEASVAALTFFAQPVVGAGLGALLLGEQLSLLFLIGGALIAAGLWLAASE